MPIYKVNGETYDIPATKQEAFEKKYPDASVSYINGSDAYDIPIGKRDSFLAKFPDARLETFEPENAPNVGGSYGSMLNTYGMESNTEQDSNVETNFFKGLHQMDKNIWKAGLWHSLRGEIANLFTGSSREEEAALNDIEYLESQGIDPREYLANIEDAEFQQLYGMSREQFNALDKSERRRLAKDLASRQGVMSEDAIKAIKKERKQRQSVIDAYQDALAQAGGDLDKAKEILRAEAEDKTWGDKQLEKANEIYASNKELQGAAKWGGLAASAIPSAAALGLSFLTKGKTAGVSKWLNKAAKMAGHAGMAGMSAGTAGLSMIEARQHGATNWQTWTTGIADGLIEFITEKIPFDKLTKPVLAAAKTKTTKTLLDAMRKADSPGRKELEKLLTEANKKLGGTLLNGKNVADWLANAATEGVSEATAEALQTMTSMIYLNPEEYPTFVDVVNAAWEGVKGGIALGGVLGGAGKAVEHSLHKDRRKQQGFVNVALVEQEGKNPFVAELVDYNPETKVYTALQDGEFVEVSENDIQYKHQYTYNEFESGRFRQLEEEAIADGTVSDAQAAVSADRVGNARQSLEDLMSQAGMTDEQKNVVFADLDKGDLPDFPADAQSLWNAADAYTDALNRDRQIQSARDIKAENERKAVLDVMREKIGGEFWQKGSTTMQENGMEIIEPPMVEVGTMQNGKQVYILSTPNDKGEVSAITEDGKKLFLLHTDLQNGTQIMPLQEFLDARVSEQKQQAEQLRMAQEAAPQLDAIRQKYQIGVQVNLGTEESPTLGQVIGIKPENDGVIIQTESGIAPYTFEQLADMEGTPIRVMTDAQQAAAEAAEIEAAEAARMTELAQSPEQISEAEKETDNAAQMENVATETPLPTNPDGSVNEDALFRESPERWAVWNDEQSQDGGVSSAQYIETKLTKAQARLAELQSMYGAEDSLNKKRAIQAEIAKQQGVVEELVAVMQKYAPENIQQPAPTNTQQERTTESVLASLNDGTLTEEEIRANIDANLAESQKAYDKYVKNAPKMGTDKDAYLAEKQKYEQGLPALQQKIDFWNGVKRTYEGAMQQESLPTEKSMRPELTEEDMDPQTPQELAARELGLKEGGIKLLWDSVKAHTGFGNGERQKFFGIFRSKDKGGMTIEAAGERLMEIDREYNLGLFDQGDPLAGVDAILDVLGDVQTIGDLRNYIANNREAQVAREASAAYSAMNAEFEATHGMTMEEWAHANEVQRIEIMSKSALTEAEEYERNVKFAEEENQYGTNEQSTGTEGLSGGENQGDAGNVEGAADSLYRQGDSILQEAQSDNTGGETISAGQTEENVSESDNQDGDTSVHGGEQTEEIDDLPPSYREIERPQEDAEHLADPLAMTIETRLKIMEETREAIHDRINTWSDKLGIKINIIDNYLDVKNKDAKVNIAKGNKTFGWFEQSTGEIFIYVPDYLNYRTDTALKEVEKTILHEGIAHKGMREMLGEEKYGELCDKVWNEVMTEKQRKEFIKYPGVSGNTRAAADEFIASVSENVKQDTVWDKITNFFKDILNSIGIDIKVADNDLKGLLKQSYQRYRKGEAKISPNDNIQSEGNVRFRHAEKESIFAQNHNLSEKLVSDFADAMARNSSGAAAYALKEIKRELRINNSNLTFNEFSHMYAPIKRELFEQFGDYDALHEAEMQRTIEARNLMEAAEQKAREEAEKEMQRLKEFEDMDNIALDEAYFAAMDAGNETRMRDIVNEAARRNGYEDTDFRMAHKAPSYDEQGYDGSMVDVANNLNGFRDSIEEQFRMNRDSAREESVKAIRKAFAAIERREIPIVKVYRAVPRGIREGNLRNNDWVALSRAYAVAHGENALEGSYNIIEASVPASDIYWDGNDINEWGYDDKSDYKYKNSANNRKLNILVIRDNNANIIPPSQRFNEKVDDVRFRSVMHGTAAKFDRFNHQHMGEGEGAQVYGWGTYLTEVEGIARTYAVTMRNKKVSDVHRENRIINSLARDLLLHNSKQDALDYLQRLLGESWSDKKRVRKQIKIIESDKFLPEGKYYAYVYTVEIPDDVLYIVYEKAIEEQLGVYDAVVVALESEGWKKIEGVHTTFVNGDQRIIVNTKAIGADLYAELSVAMGSDKAASEFLSRNGVVGISYAAENRSGGRADGARNYVIFNEDNAQIQSMVRFRTLGEKGAANLDKAEELKQRISQVSTAHNSLLNATSSALSEDKDTNNSENDNILFRTRITPEQDAAYMKAVEAGDMETAQRMVDETADRVMKNSKVRDSQGKLIRVTHYSPNEFTSFDPQKIGSSTDWGVFGRGFYFSNKDHRLYGKNRYEGYLNLENPFIINGAEEAYAYKEAIADFAGVQYYEVGKKETDDYTDYLISQGYDGVIYNDTFSGFNEYVAFYPYQFKLADVVDVETKDDNGNVIPLSERFNEEKDDIRFRTSNNNQAIFVSNAAKAIEGIKMEKATPEQWLKMIEKNGGLKAGEDKWMGLSDWLKESDKKTLTKQEVLDFINEHMIVIDEEKYGEVELSALQEEFNEIYDNIIDNVGNEDESNLQLWEVVMNPMERAWEELRDRYSGGDDFDMAFSYDSHGNIEINDPYAAGYFLGVKPINNTRLDYTTSGLQNKHEIALTVPTIEPWNETDEIHFGDAGDGRAVAWIRFGETWERRPSPQISRKVLVIDEIQSKRHQEGRDRGYSMSREEYQKRLDALETEGGERLRRRTELLRTLKEKYGEDFHSYLKLENSAYVPNESVMSPEEVQEWNATSQEEINDAIDALKKQKRAGVPDAPFDKNWHELAMKRMLRYAAENGYDVVAWTKGEQQAERYNIGDVVASVDYRLNDDGTYHVDTIGRNGYQMDEIPTTFNSETELVEIFGKDIARKIAGNLENDKQTIGEADKEIDELREWFSKNTKTDEADLDSIFESAINNPEQSKRWNELEVKKEEARRGHSLSETDFRIGGEGMKGFYDKMLPAFMNKYGKKWGVKVEDIELPNLEESGRVMHSIPVTEEMKASVMEGQTMFRTRRADQSAESFCLDCMRNYVRKYGSLTTIKVMPVNEETAKELGYTLAELKELDGVYLGKKGIAIFAKEDIKDSDEVESTIFHETIYHLAKRYPKLIDAGKFFWEKADKNQWLKDIKEHIEDKYAEETLEKKYEEMLCFTMEFYAQHEGLDELANNLSGQPKKDVEFITNKTNYGRSNKLAESSKDSSRGEDDKNLNQENGGKSESTSDENREAQEGTGIQGVNTYERFGYEPENEDPRRKARRLDESRRRADDRGDVVQVRNTTNGEDGPQSEGTLFRTEISPEVRREMDVISAQAIVNGTYLKAPNGKDSKLTPEKWAMVRTKNFLNWFGDWINDPENASKVIDENGEPMVVYHGTLAKNLTRFDKDFIGSRYSYDEKGFFFISRESIANDYATPDFGTGRGAIIPAFINLKNPLFVDQKWAAKNGLGNRVFKDNDVIEFWDNYQTLMIEESQNNDGVIISDGTDLMVVAFEPSQIKSATDNTGEFSESEDIRFKTTGTPTEQVVNDGLVLSVEEFTNLAADIFSALPEEIRREVVENASRDNYNLKKAIFQLSTSLAEKKNLSDEEIELAKLIAQKVEDAVLASGVEMTRPFTTNEALWMLYQSTNPTSEYDVIGNARKAVVADNLGFAEGQKVERENDADNVRFRSARNQSYDSAAAMYNNEQRSAWGMLRETYQDMYRSVQSLIEAIEKTTGKVAQSWENILTSLNALSSKNLADKKKYLRDFLTPMWDAALAIRDKYHKSLEQIERYLMIKHGLERNKVLAARDARNFYREQADREIAAIKADKSLSKAEQKARIQRVEDTYNNHVSDIEAGIDAKFQEFRAKDYGGLTALFSDFADYGTRQDYESEELYQEAALAARTPKYATLAETELAAQQEVDAFEKEVDKTLVDNLWKKINAATKETLRHQYANNMLTKEQYERVRDMFEFYVPLRGFVDTTAEDTYSYYVSGQQSKFANPLQGAKGRKTQAETPLGWIGSMAESAIQMDNKNTAKLALYYFAVNRPNNDILKITPTWYEWTGEVDADGKKIFEPVYPTFNGPQSGPAMQAQMDAFESMMEQQAQAGNAYKGKQRIDLKEAVIRAPKSTPEHIVTVKVAGEDYSIIINANPRAAQAINGMLNIDKGDNPLYRAARAILRFQASIKTSLAPLFWITNFMRDVSFAFINTSIRNDVGYTKEFAKNYPHAFRVFSYVQKNRKSALGNTKYEKYYTEFAENGGITGYTSLTNNTEYDQMMKTYAKNARAGKFIKGIKGALEIYQDLGESFEQVSRFAAYITARESGKDISESIYEAKEVTINFNRKGSGKAITWEESGKMRRKNGKPLTDAERIFFVTLGGLSPVARSLFMFFNAGMQGVRMIAKLAYEHPGKSAAWAGIVFTMGLINAMMHAMMEDDDEYLDMPDYVRRTNILIGKNGTYFKWSLPHEVRPFYAMADIFVQHAMGRKPNKNIAAELAETFGEWMPINPFKDGLNAFVPDIIRPFVEIKNNKDFTGSPIYREYRWLTEEQQKNMPAYEKGFDSTSKVLVDISEILNDVSGGDQTDAGFININPAVVEHLAQEYGGGPLKLAEQFFKTIGVMTGDQEFSIRNTPFLSTFMVAADDRYRNAHTTELFKYYKGMADDVKRRAGEYKAEKDKEGFDKLRASDDFQIFQIYRKYEKMDKFYNEELKRAKGDSERKEIMSLQDAHRKRMIEEISNL